MQLTRIAKKKRPGRKKLPAARQALPGLRLISVLLVIWLVVLSAPAIAHDSVGWAVAAEGEVTAIDTSSSSRVLRVRDAIFRGESIKGAEHSRVKIMFLLSASVVTLRERSLLKITDSANTMFLESGKLGYVVFRQFMRPGQVDDIRTTNAIIRTRLGGAVIVESDRTETEDGTAVAVTTVSSLSGTVWAGALGGSLTRLGPGESVRISGGKVEAVRALSIRDIEQALTGLGALGRPASLVEFGVSAGPLRTATSPLQRMGSNAAGGWRLLIDHGKGFERWVGTSLDGCVAADCYYDDVQLLACVRAAKGIVQPSARVACARSPHSATVQYRDTRGRRMATGPVAGRLVVVQAVADTAGWMIMSEASRSGRGRYIQESDSTLALSECETAIDGHIAKLEGSAWACVRLPASEDTQYFDNLGHLMAEGPFAGGMVVYQATD
jgi:hypothetical protein